MANTNTKSARHRGHSDMKHLMAGKDKNYGVRTGHRLNTSALRKASGKKPYGKKKTVENFGLED